MSEILDEHARDGVSDDVWAVIYKLRTIQENYESQHKARESCPLIAAAMFGLEWGYKVE